jgi:hypothetical protein
LMIYNELSKSSKNDLKRTIIEIIYSQGYFYNTREEILKK